jgi:peroxiredoxin
MLDTGTKAPDFTLPNSTKEATSLSSLLGDKGLVIAFFPAAFSGVCDNEMCALQEALTAFNDLGANVVGISVDLPWSNKEFKGKHSLNFPLLSDFKHEVIKAYDVVFENFAHVEGMDAAVRSVYVLDKNGVIRWTWAAPNPGVLPELADVKAAVQSLG